MKAYDGGPRRSNVTFAPPRAQQLAKASPRGSLAGRDRRRPKGQRGASQRSESMMGLTGTARGQFERWMKTFHYDIDVYAMYRQIMKRTPNWKLDEVVLGKGNPQNKEGLEQFFHLPDGRHPCQQILRATVARTSMIGDAYWLLRYVGDEERSKAYGLLRKTIQDGEVRGMVEKALEPMLEGVTPIGFEYLAGSVVWDKDEKVWVQAIGSQVVEHPEQDVVRFENMDPAGGPMNTLRWLEAWSDASVSTFKLNADAVATGGMTDTLVILYGVSNNERRRIEALAYDRADPARVDEQYIPMFVNASGMPGDRIGAQAVELSQRGREAGFGEFDKELRIRKAGATGTPLSAVGEFRSVNRATMEEMTRMMVEFEIWPSCTDLAESVTEQIIAERFSVDDWEFAFAKPDTRSAELAHQQETDNVKNGATAPYNRWVDLHGQEQADVMLANLAQQGDDEERYKVPWVVSGGKWMPMTDAGGEEAAPMALEGQPGAKAAAEGVAGDEQGNGAGATSQPGQEQPTGNKRDAGKASTPTEMAASLDSWQATATSTLRKRGTAVDDDALAKVNTVLPSVLVEHISTRLVSAETPHDVSDAFRDGRSVLNKAAERFEEVRGPLLGPAYQIMAAAMGQVFDDRNSDARRRLTEQASEMDAGFEPPVQVDPDDMG